MLVLRRNRGQSIVIGKHAEIIVKVLEDKNGVIRIGINAPKDVNVDRLEVYKQRQKNSDICSQKPIKKNHKY